MQARAVVVQLVGAAPELAAKFRPASTGASSQSVIWTPQYSFEPVPVGEAHRLVLSCRVDPVDPDRAARGRSTTSARSSSAPSAGTAISRRCSRSRSTTAARPRDDARRLPLRRLVDRCRSQPAVERLADDGDDHRVVAERADRRREPLDVGRAEQVRELSRRRLGSRLPRVEVDLRAEEVVASARSPAARSAGASIR